MKFHLRLFRPLPNAGAIDTIDVNPNVTALRWSTSLPGGFNGLDVGYADEAMPRVGFLPREVHAREFAHVEVHAGSHTAWEGRVMRLTDIGGAVRAFSGIGYGLTATQDDWFSSSDNTLTTSGGVLKTVLTQAAPLLNLGGAAFYVDPGVQHAPAEFTQQTPAQVIDSLCKEGGGAVSDRIWDWSVWEGRTAWFLPRLAPQQPTYKIPFDRTVTRDRDCTKAYSTVNVLYQTTSGGASTITTNSTTPGFINKYGILRAVLIQGSTMTAAGAAQFQETYRTTHNGPEVSVKIVRHDNRGLEMPGGAEMPPWLVRAGQWVQVGDDVPRIIVQTQYDANSGQLDVTAEQLPFSFFESVRQVQAAAGYAAKRTNPNTGRPL